MPHSTWIVHWTASHIADQLRKRTVTLFGSDDRGQAVVSFATNVKQLDLSPNRFSDKPEFLPLLIKSPDEDLAQDTHQEEPSAIGEDS